MNCRDVRDVADSFLAEELLTETNHEILRHLDGCASCRAEIDARRRVRGALRGAFERSPDLQPQPAFVDRLRETLRDRAAQERGRREISMQWLALAAGVLLAAGLTAAVVLNRSIAPTDGLVRDAVGDHRNCALNFRLAKKPVSLEEAAERFDPAFRMLVSAPPDNIPTSDGAAHVLERHSCEYDGRRFGHVVMQYRGRVVSLLLTSNDVTTGGANTVDAISHSIGHPMKGISVVSVSGAHHAVLLVGDLGAAELTQLAAAVSVPLVHRIDADVRPDRDTLVGLFLVQPVPLR